MTTTSSTYCAVRAGRDGAPDSLLAPLVLDSVDLPGSRDSRNACARSDLVERVEPRRGPLKTIKAPSRPGIAHATPSECLIEESPRARGHRPPFIADHGFPEETHDVCAAFDSSTPCQLRARPVRERSTLAPAATEPPRSGHGSGSKGWKIVACFLPPSPSSLSPASPPQVIEGIAAGPNGNLWFTEDFSGPSEIDEINPSTDTFNEFHRPQFSPSGSRRVPTAISGSPLARSSARSIRSTHAITEFNIPGANPVPMGSRRAPTATSGSPTPT